MRFTKKQVEQERAKAVARHHRSNKVLLLNALVLAFTLGAMVQRSTNFLTVGQELAQGYYQSLTQSRP